MMLLCVCVSTSSDRYCCAIQSCKKKNRFCVSACVRACVRAVAVVACAGRLDFVCRAAAVQSKEFCNQENLNACVLSTRVLLLLCLAFSLSSSSIQKAILLVQYGLRLREKY